MSKFEKALSRLRSQPKDYTYAEARYILSQLGFKEFNSGRTSDSRVQFYRESDSMKILLHKPHPGDEMKPYAVRFLAEFIEGLGEL